MRKLIILLTTLFILIGSLSFAGDTYVRGHWRDTDRDGIKDTYVSPHYRTAPNDTIRDNYSTYPNINPYTGKQGTINPDNNYNNPYNNPYSNPYKELYGQ